MTNHPNTATPDLLKTPSEGLAVRLLDLADADLEEIGRGGAEFGDTFDNSFDNSVSVRLLDLADADVIGPSAAQFDNSFDNSFSNIA